MINVNEDYQICKPILIKVTHEIWTFYYYLDSILFIHSMKIITYETIYFLSKSGLVNASFNPVSMHSNTSNFELGIKFNLFTLTKH